MRLDLHVHGADVARLVLSDPQLPVFGWVHFSKQLVHRLDCLQGTRDGEERMQSEVEAEPGACPLSHATHTLARQSSCFRGLWQQQGSWEGLCEGQMWGLGEPGVGGRRALASALIPLMHATSRPQGG